MRIELQQITRDLAHKCAEVDRQVSIDTHAPNKTEVIMPEVWLTQVMSLQSMSRNSFNFLATTYVEHGFITLAQASEWLTIERIGSAPNQEQVWIDLNEGENIKECLIRLASTTETENT